jgi:hypothetical protein
MKQLKTVERLATDGAGISQKCNRVSGEAAGLVACGRKDERFPGNSFDGAVRLDDLRLGCHGLDRKCCGWSPKLYPAAAWSWKIEAFLLVTFF